MHALSKIRSSTYEYNGNCTSVLCDALSWLSSWFEIITCKIMALAFTMWGYSKIQGRGAPSHVTFQTLDRFVGGLGAQCNDLCSQSLSWPGWMTDLVCSLLSTKSPSLSPLLPSGFYNLVKEGLSLFNLACWFYDLWHVPGLLWPPFSY